MRFRKRSGKAVWRTLRIGAQLFAVGALVVVVAVLLARWRNVHMWETQLRIQREAGFPASPEEVDALYPPIAAEENGAPYYLAAAKALVPLPGTLRRTTPYVGRPSVKPPYDMEKAAEGWRAYLKRNAHASALLTRAATFPKARYDIDFDTILRWRDRDTCKALEALIALPKVAMAAAAVEGDGDAFVGAAALAFAMVHSLDGLPSVSAFKSQRTLLAEATSQFETALQFHALDVTHLLALEGMLRAAPGYRALRPALGVQMYQLLHGAQSPEMDTALAMSHRWRYVDPKMTGAARRSAGGAIESGLGVFYRLIDMRHGYYASQVAAARVHLARFESSLEPAAPARAAGPLQPTPSQVYFYEGYADGVPQFSPETYVKTDMQLRVLGARLALERYRLRHGDWPDALEDLVPQFTDMVPTDPFDDLPLVYRREPGGFRLYSTGRDRVDDHGDGRGGFGDDIAMNHIDGEGTKGIYAIP